MQKAFASLLLICLTLASAAQDKKSDPTAQLSGTVKNEKGEGIQDVSITLLNNPGKGGITKFNGNYSLTVPAGKDIYVVFSSIEFSNDTVKMYLAPGEKKKFDTVLKSKGFLIPTVDIRNIDTAHEDTRVIPSTVVIPVEEMSKLPNVSMDISALLYVTGLGVTSGAGELSTQYSVRGGNYDENLVYVNDFEVFRPFLIRSGQQEGLSFINPDMVGSMTFSSGGFEAKYGDKMASVLNSYYKVPKKFGGSVGFGLLGGSVSLEGIIKKKKAEEPRVTYMLGVRQKSSQYILKSQETKGEYSPAFLDVQSFMTFKLSKKLSLEWIVNYASNKFIFLPVDRQTTFGVVNNVLRLNIYFEGQEVDQYKSLMSGLGLVHKPNENLKMKWMFSGYRSVEEETFDILGEYYLGEVESDLGQEDFGQTKFNLGVGGLLNYGRNKLESTILNTEHRGTWKRLDSRHELQWGLKYQREIVKDKLNEWEVLDSAGYSIPYNGEDVTVSRVLKTNFELNSNRYSGFVQDQWRISEDMGIMLTYGVRFSYWNINKEWVASPRMQFSIKPPRFNKDTKNVIFTAAVGMYNQPPFYREMRNLDGVVNTNLKAQKSVHAVVGANYDFTLWKRKFSFITEVYYKYLYDMVPYEYDNVLIRYYGENRSTGYAAGIDMRLNGEFVKGTDSYINLSIMSTRENLKDDYLTVYFDAAGNEVLSTSDSIVNTATRYPGSIPRPTDQRVKFSMFFQDYIPRRDDFKMHLNLVFATGLPFGPPDRDRFRDTLRIPPYRRVDIGFSAQLFNYTKRSKKKDVKGFMRHVESIWATLEIYNLLGVNNTVSYLWIKDLSDTVYAVPNNLSARRFNFRLVCDF